MDDFTVYTGNDYKQNLKKEIKFPYEMIRLSAMNNNSSIPNIDHILQDSYLVHDSGERTYLE